MELLPWHEAKPCQEVLLGNNGTKYDYNLAIGTFEKVMVYTHSGKPFAINPIHLPFETLYLYWFDPVAGNYSYLGSRGIEDSLLFDPPKRLSEQSDWAGHVHET
ncbi:MAG: putative collagen-binding domain-containing protein [Christensenellales bacterium]